MPATRASEAPDVDSLTTTPTTSGPDVEIAAAPMPDPVGQGNNLPDADAPDHIAAVAETQAAAALLISLHQHEALPGLTPLANAVLQLGGYPQTFNDSGSAPLGSTMTGQPTLDGPFPWHHSLSLQPSEAAPSNQSPTSPIEDEPSVSAQASLYHTMATSAPLMEDHEFDMQWSAPSGGPVAVNTTATPAIQTPPTPEDPWDVDFIGGFMPAAAPLLVPIPPQQSNPNIGPLGPDNHCVTEFLTYWARLGSMTTPFRRPHARVPSLIQVNQEMAKQRPVVHVDDLMGDALDFQALDWQKMGVTRRLARERRRLVYQNYVSAPGSDKWRPGLLDVDIPNTESFFRFSRMDLRQNVHLAHFQLRNLLGCAGQSRAFYPGKKTVHCLNPMTGQSETAMNLSQISNVQISTLDADNDVVIAGTFTGEYCMKGVYAQGKAWTRGQVTTNASGITNHLQLYRARASGSPRVAFASNDQGFRVMDVATEQFIMEKQYPFPMNCSAISPDRRLRIVVGDSTDTLIVNAESGEIIHGLAGHRDYGFACAWSDDGWTVATAAQDRGIKIWDARRWTDSRNRGTPVTTIRSEMAGVRGLRFSPAGSGPRVLVAAEEADFVNMIDAQMFRRKQTFDVFGEIGGISFTDDGQKLNILCCDRNRGGLVQLDRHDYGANEHAMSCERDAGGFNVASTKRRRLYLDDLEPF